MRYGDVVCSTFEQELPIDFLSKIIENVETTAKVWIDAPNRTKWCHASQRVPCVIFKIRCVNAMRVHCVCVCLLNFGAESKMRKRSIDVLFCFSFNIISTFIGDGSIRCNGILALILCMQANCFGKKGKKTQTEENIQPFLALDESIRWKGHKRTEEERRNWTQLIQKTAHNEKTDLLE